MSSVGALLRDLEASMARGSSDERATILERLTDLFLATASGMAEDQVGVFDVVIGRLARAIEVEARIELSKRLAPVPNAPSGVVRQLALDEIEVARPVLVASPRLSDHDLVAVAAAKGRDHMLAITERPDLGEPVTDFLILRGGRVVSHAVAANQTARFSRHGMGVLVMRAQQDDALQATLGSRADIPEDLAEQLLAAAKSSARRRLEASLAPSLAGAVAGAVERGAETVATKTIGEDVGKFSAALADIKRLDAAGQLDEPLIAQYAGSGALEHAICGVASAVRLSLPATERIMFGPDRDAVLLVARAMGWSWETARALIGLRKGDGRSPAVLERAQQSFRNLTPATSQRVLGFLRMRDAAPSDSSAPARP
jgi:uncharacterized protein (DUF2336 family)